MPDAVVVIQIYPHARLATPEDVEAGHHDKVGELFNECRVDLAPYESRSDSWFFDVDNYHIRNSVLNSTTGHNFVTGDFIRFEGTDNYDATYKVRKIDNNTIALIGADVPQEPEQRNTGVAGWKENSYLRPADFAVSTANRLAYVGGPDIIQFSDVFAPTIINAYFNRVLVNEGAGDYITALLPVQDDSLIVFKRSSIYLISNTSALGSDLKVIEITRQMGCVSQGTVQEIGDLIYFLSDNGIYAIDAGIRQQTGIATPIQALEIVNTPTSESIQDIISGIDFTYADRFTSAYHDNRYFLAVVSKQGGGMVNRVLVYNQLLKEWETIDEIPDDFVAKKFVVMPVNGKNQLHLVSTNSSIVVWEANEAGVDRYFNGENTYTSTPVSFSVSSRSYDAQSFNIKKWHRVGVAVTRLSTEDDTGLSFGFSTVNPDNAVLIYSTAPNDGYRKTFRLLCRRVGQMFTLTITNRLNKFIPAGRLKISEYYVESSESARSTKSFSDAGTHTEKPYDVEIGFRPAPDRNIDDPILVTDPAADNPL